MQPVHPRVPDIISISDAIFPDADLAGVGRQRDALVRLFDLARLRNAFGYIFHRANIAGDFATGSGRALCPGVHVANAAVRMLNAKLHVELDAFRSGLPPRGKYLCLIVRMQPTAPPAAEALIGR